MTVAYNNKLKRVTNDMKLGINSDVNAGTVSVGIKHNLGQSKVKLLHDDHKDVSKELRKSAEKVVEKESTDIPKSTHTKHDIDLILKMMIAAGAIAFFIFR